MLMNQIRKGAHNICSIMCYLKHWEQRGSVDSSSSGVNFFVMGNYLIPQDLFIRTTVLPLVIKTFRSQDWVIFKSLSYSRNSSQFMTGFWAILPLSHLKNIVKRSSQFIPAVEHLYQPLNFRFSGLRKMGGLFLLINKLFPWSVGKFISQNAPCAGGDLQEWNTSHCTETDPSHVGHIHLQIGSFVSWIEWYFYQPKDWILSIWNQASLSLLQHWQ